MGKINIFNPLLIFLRSMSLSNLEIIEKLLNGKTGLLGIERGTLETGSKNEIPVRNAAP